MPYLRYLRSALIDLASIQAYIAAESGNPAAGRNFARLPRQKCKHLSALPGQMGRARTELAPNIRSFAHGNYVIYFRYAGSEFQVINILEGHRDAEGHFNEDR